MVVLEREDRARARGATIYASIDGYGSTCDAYHRVQMAPDGEEIVRAMTLAIERSGRAREEIGYVNYHGTSTHAERRGRVAVRAPGVRRARRSPAGLVGEVDDRPSAGRQRRRRRRDGRAGDGARRSCRRRSISAIPIRRAIWTSSRTRARRRRRRRALQLPRLRIEEQRARARTRMRVTDVLDVLDRRRGAGRRGGGDWCSRAPARACGWSTARRFRATSCAATR